MTVAPEIFMLQEISNCFTFSKPKAERYRSIYISILMPDDLLHCNFVSTL